jgi:enamine deaminase RidA (YjgF/YER057c/UK114 family)
VDHIIVTDLAAFEEEWEFSHVVRHRGLLHLSGVTGTGVDGSVPLDPTDQFEQAFRHLRLYLAAAGAELTDVLEMTTYHVHLRMHLAAFTAVKSRHLPAPYPAWSAIGVSELITAGALVEMRVVARDPNA